MVLVDPFTGKKKMIKHYDSFLKKWIRSKNNIGTGAFGQVYICEPKPEYANDSECQINNPHSLLQHNTFSIRKIPIPKGDMRPQNPSLVIYYLIDYGQHAFNT